MGNVRGWGGAGTSFQLGVGRGRWRTRRCLRPIACYPAIGRWRFSRGATWRTAQRSMRRSVGSSRQSGFCACCRRRIFGWRGVLRGARVRQGSCVCRWAFMRRGTWRGCWACSRGICGVCSGRRRWRLSPGRAGRWCRSVRRSRRGFWTRSRARSPNGMGSCKSPDRSGGECGRGGFLPSCGCGGISWRRGRHLYGGRGGMRFKSSIRQRRFGSGGCSI